MQCGNAGALNILLGGHDELSDSAVGLNGLELLKSMVRDRSNVCNTGSGENSLADITFFWGGGVKRVRGKEYHSP